MAPPQQAGKFRPRKPAAKKVVPGGGTGAPTPIAVGSSTSAARGGGGDEGGSGGRGAGGGRGRGGRDGGRGFGGRDGGRGFGGRDGGRGGGRDGGRGRGRGRGMPIQQGSAFFTAAPVPAKTSAAGNLAGMSKTAAAVARRLQLANEGGPSGTGFGDELPQEEIVGMMDEAIGGPGPDGSKSNRILERENLNEQQEGGPGAAKKADRFMEDETGYTYDSDSSKESKGKFGFALRKIVMPEEEPLKLPFPSKKNVAPGIGHDYYPQQQNLMEIIMDDDDDAMVPLAATSCHVNPVVTANATTSASVPIAHTSGVPNPSPFVHVNQRSAFEDEKQSWFLIQFPTRLPPLRSALGDNPNNNNNNADTTGVGAGGDEEEQAALNQTMKLDTAEVATPPVRVDCFDNVMSSAMAGRMGKIKIYKSGKTVLVLTAPDGTQTNFHVTQGLPCAFQQQAAMIDMEHSSMVQLGKVGKTLVITPDLDSL